MSHGSSVPDPAIIIDAMHSHHNTARRYTPEALRQILLALRPHSICTETEAQHIGDDGYCKLDVELDRSRQVPRRCRVGAGGPGQLGIRQVSFEREGRDQRYRETRYLERTGKS